jgi:uncharacterized protein
VKFILDGMLGKLSRWLRMMGYDSKYSTVLTDSEMLAIAKNEDRALLTRDLALYQQAVNKGIEAAYIEGTTEPERLAQTVDQFGISLNIDMEKSRCPKCNSKIASVPKDQITDKVEKNTLTFYNDFWECPNCGAVYWQGAHWTKIRETLTQAKLKQKKEN